MCKILHLSDLHFGEKRKTTKSDLLVTKRGAKELAQSIVNNIKKDDSGVKIKPDCLVITGDLSNSSNAVEYDFTEIFLNEILKHLNLKKNRLLVVPGNHDVDWKNHDGIEKYASFKHFYERYFKKKWDLFSPTYIRFKTNSDETIIFGLDSNSTLTKEWCNYGNVNLEQLRNLKKLVKKLKLSDSALKIVALHHHVLPVYNYFYSFENYKILQDAHTSEQPPVSLLMNASQLLKVCREFGIASILHGHAHVP